MMHLLVCPRCRAEYPPEAERCPVDGSPVYPAYAVSRIGARFKDYELQGILGEGGMGTVYQGQHVVLEKPVAIKILHPEMARQPSLIEQFQREAKAASRIRHPHIVDVTDFGITPDGLVFLVMEHLEGESLEGRLRREKRFAVFDAVNVVYQIARALGAAHEHGIVHRDLKPANVLLTQREGRRKVVRRVIQGPKVQFLVEQEGTFDYVKLLDFGIAKFIDLGPSSTTRAGLISGTPQYLSPEQIRGQAADGRSDLYALGIVFYEMVTGSPPFNSDVLLELFNAHVSSPVTPPRVRAPDALIDERTDQTILRCLEKDPARRFQTMDSLVDALQDCISDRVFLRNAHKLPGAVEHGIVPPPSREARNTCASGVIVDPGKSPASCPPTLLSHAAATEVSPAIPTRLMVRGLTRPSRRRLTLVAAVGVTLVCVVAAVWLGARGSIDPAPQRGSVPAQHPVAASIRAQTKPSAPQAPPPLGVVSEPLAAQRSAEAVSAPEPRASRGAEARPSKRRTPRASLSSVTATPATPAAEQSSAPAAISTVSPPPAAISAPLSPPPAAAKPSRPAQDDISLTVDPFE